MPDIDWQEHKLKLLVLIALVLGILLSSEDEKEIATYTPVKQIINEIEDIEEEPNIIIEHTSVKKIMPAKKPSIEIEEQQIEDITPIIKDEIINIYQATDSTGRYTVKLISKKSIKQENERASTRYIMMSGQIENNNDINDFSLSLNERYMDYVSDIYIEINDIASDSNKTLTCDAYFLSGLDIETMYKIKIDISNDELNCYMLSSEPLPPFLKNLALDKAISNIDDNMTTINQDSNLLDKEVMNK